MNPYKILGVSVDATDTEIKKAYKKLASRYHPDKKTANQDEFLKCKLARDVLLDKDRRAKFDATGEVDDGAKPVDEVEAKMIMLFTSMIDEEKCTGNIIEAAVDNCRGVLASLVNELTINDTALKKLEKITGRVKSKCDENLFEVVLSDKIERLKFNTKKIEHEYDIVEQILKRLEDYDDETPELLFTSNTGWSNYTNSNI